MNPLLLPLSVLFRAGVGLRLAGYRAGWFKTRRLSRPVISVGNLTVGGTGKTPLVATVARILLRNGMKPSILSRGYGRTSNQNLIEVAPESDLRSKPNDIGDEPALLARMLPEVPIILCADRYRGGKAAEDQFQIDAHILDDGFQHFALARNLDIVTLDATQNLSNWNLLPAGRQREPLSALRRAQIAVITRADSAGADSLQQQVGKVSPKTKLFSSQTLLRGWVDACTGEPIAQAKLREMKFTAFCGIGNPSAFFADLRRWGINLVAEDAFPDHHVYTGKEIGELAAKARRMGATALLTTQKDSVKFSPGWSRQLPILCCEIEAQILEANDFERAVLTHVREGH